MENIKSIKEIIDETLNKPEEDENVSHPSHYTWLKEKSGIEVIDITRHMNFNLGNAIKYILRSGKKPIIDKDLSDDFNRAAIQDLRKAIWYLNDEINRIEKWGL